MIKTIVVPIDFSPCSENALRFAYELAGKNNSRVVLVHAFIIQYTSAYVPVQLILGDVKKQQSESVLHLKRLVSEIKGNEKIKTQFICREDLAVDLILKVIKETRADLVVMGTRGGSVFKNILFGSNAVKVIESSGCPVITVPDKINTLTFDKVVFAVDYNKENVAELKKVIELFGYFKPVINLVHLGSKSGADKKTEKAFKEFEITTRQQVQYPKFEFTFVPSSKVVERLADYAESSEADLLVMSTHHRDLLEKVFKQSVTEKMAYKIKVPLMVFHH